MTAVQAPADALIDLRRMRRANHRRNIHWVDALYNVYITAGLSIVFVLLASSWFPNEKLDDAGTLDFATRGPAWLGLGFAVAIGFGLRSGGRGGPLVLEGPVVFHELMAPVDRRLALREPAVKQLRFMAFGGLVVGGIVGVLASHRLPGSPVFTTLCAAAAFSLAATLAVGTALLFSGHRFGIWVANGTGLLLLAWSAADVAMHTTTSPLTFVGSVAFTEAKFQPLAIVGVLVVPVVVAMGLAGLGGTSIEEARRRANLVKQLRFAVTLQDVRTIVLLRRQLSQERPRTTPWIRIGRRSSRAFPTWRRDWQGYLRFPVVRLVRLTALAAIAGIALGLTWKGITPAFLVTALALFIAAYEAAEPIAQEIDHPSRWFAAPEDSGTFLVKHLPAAFLVMLIECVIAAAVSLILVPPDVVLRLAAIVLVPVAGSAAIAGAVGTAVGTPGPMADIGGMASGGTTGITDGLGGDIVGYQVLARLVLPPAIVIGALAPILAAGSDPLAIRTEKVSNYVTYSLAAAVVGFLYLRTRRPTRL